ncbi:MOSC domain-containing protein [Blastococcus sp. SYSU D00669]
MAEQLVGLLDPGGLTVRVAELWRYPVKSLQGERLQRAEVGALGVAGDRQWALFDLDTGFGLTARRVPDLLFAAGRLRDDGGVEVVLPDGTVTTDDAVLSDWAGRRIGLRPATGNAPRYEGIDDDESDGWYPWHGAAEAFHDNPDFRVTLVSTGTLASWDRRRFRANVVLDGEGEDALVGTRQRLGSVVLELREPVSRCVMVTRPQPGGIGRDNGVLKTIHRERASTLAVGALVRQAGTVAVGDELTGA